MELTRRLARLEARAGVTPGPTSVAEMSDAELLEVVLTDRATAEAFEALDRARRCGGEVPALEARFMERLTELSRGHDARR